MADLRTDKIADTNPNAVAAFLNTAIGGAAITVPAEGGDDAITVSIQLQDAEGDDLAEIGYVLAFFSDAATGIGIAGTAPTTVVAGTDGAILAELVADKLLLLQSEADGDIDIDIGEAGADTWYLVVILPGGRQVVSDPIVFS